MGANSIDFDAGLIRRFDRPGPRYTSYPTADRFVTTFDAEAYRALTGLPEVRLDGYFPAYRKS